MKLSILDIEFILLNVYLKASLPKLNLDGSNIFSILLKRATIDKNII